MNSITRLQIRAAWQYRPSELCAYLKKDGETCIIDKELAIKDEYDARLFFVALSNNYGWNYTPPFKSVTAYLETDGTSLYGGAYDLNVHAKLTRKLLASSAPTERFTPYIYTDEEFSAIMKKMSETS